MTIVNVSLIINDHPMYFMCNIKNFDEQNFDKLIVGVIGKTL